MPNPDLIVHNGPIYTRASRRSRVEALAVWSGRITDIGTSRDILRLRARSTRTFNLEGRAVLPGFADSHIHLLSYGMLLRNLDVSKSGSLREIQNHLRQRASKGNHSWILGRGWDQEKLRERRYPNKYDLDKVASEPVFLLRVCGHVAVANSAALSASGIDRNTANPDGGFIEKDSQGEPTGILKERAIEMVQNNVPRDEKETREALISACRRLARLGLTSLHCIIDNAGELRALQKLKSEGKIAQSIYAILPAGMLDHLVAVGVSTERNVSNPRIGGVKVYLDGSLGARTAALTEPYTDSPDSSGMLTITRDQLLEVAAKARDSNFQLCLHAIGDKAVEIAIETLDRVFGAQGCKLLRHRIEHSSLTSPRQISRMRKLGIVASIQPRFILSDTWAERRLGPTRVHHLYPFSSMIRAGVMLAAGSDCPVEDPSPLEGIWSGVVRPGLGSEESLTIDQAIDAYTVGASYASFSENERGTLEPGKIADMVVLDRDPFESSLEDLRKTRVERTIINGEVAA